MNIKKEPFGKTGDNKEVHLFTLQNSNGITVKITNYGGIITYLSVPDSEGKSDNIVLGFNSLEEYVSPSYIKGCPYLGAIIGRYANRIANGTFSVEGRQYNLVCNDGPNHLHGGTTGFDKVVWDASEFRSGNFTGLRLDYFSRDMEEGYPGNLNITVIYSLTDQNELKIEYRGQIDRACPVNLTQHTYFNLNGMNSDILGHELYLNANKYTAADDTLIPTGEMAYVANTPLDFLNPRKIGERIKMIGIGYDHNFVLNKQKEDELSLAARVKENTSGRILEMYTTEPGVQLYSGNFLNGTYTAARGKKMNKHYGFCLEAQHYPDSPNKPDFPSAILTPGKKYLQLTVYKFLVK
jgi:aldose 1-epimerase